MNLSISNAGAVKNELYGGNVDFDGDTFRAILVRDGFSFNSSTYKYLKNFKATLTGTMSVSASAKTISKDPGTAYGTTGFVSGNLCTLSYLDDANPQVQIDSVIRLTSVADDLIRFVHVSGDTETIATEQSVTITSNDELPDNTDGYTDSDNTNPVGGIAVTFTLDGETLTLNPFDLSTFGPDPLIDSSPGMIIYDDTNANNVVICYASFDPWTLQF